MTQKKDEGQLIAIEDLKAKEVFASDSAVGDIIAKLKRLAEPKLDPETEEGREERRSLAYKIARTKTAVDWLGKDYVADLKKVTTAVDVRRKKWRDDIEVFQAEIRKPLTEYEEKEAARIKGHRDKIQEMRDLISYDYEPDSADIEERIAQVEMLGMRDYQEFADEAKTVAENSSGRLAEKLAHVIKAEEQAAELKRMKEAEEERKKKEETERIEREAEERARQKLLAESATPEPTPAPAPATPQSELPLSSPAPAPMSHTKTAGVVGTTTPGIEQKRQVNQKILAALQDECMISESAAKAIIKAVANGKIPHVTITYP